MSQISRQAEVFYYPLFPKNGANEDLFCRDAKKNIQECSGNTTHYKPHKEEQREEHELISL